MALPDSAENEKRPKLGLEFLILDLEIGNLEISQEPTENTDLHTESRDGGSPGQKG